MLAVAQIEWWHWVGFILAVLVFLSLDLGVFHRRAHTVGFGEALAWTGVWFSVAMLFARYLRGLPGQEEEAEEFLLGYVIELSLSMDNVFVIALIFSYFRVPPEFQHRVLFWGILGALVMRGLMIWVGTELVQEYQWMLYVFGVFLVLTGVRMLSGQEEEIQPESNPVLRLARKYFPIAPAYEGARFVTVFQGRRALTPLALVLVMVETTDLVFALDSIPAIFGVTQKSFVVFTSNVCAILGLRSLYFVLAGAMTYFRYLKYGLAAVLVFIGFKMLAASKLHLGPRVSLLIVGLILAVAIGVSLVAAARERGRNPPAPPAGPR